MASVYDFKPAFQNLLRPAVNALVRSGVAPNHLTLAALAGSIAVGAMLLLAANTPPLLVLLPGWLLVRMGLNAMDGMAAREHAMKTRLGGALNEVGDVLSDVALYLPLAVLRADLLWPMVTFCLTAMLTEFSGLLGPALGSRRRYEGPMGKSDRALTFGAMGLVGGLAPATLAAWPALAWIATALAAVTCVNRVRAALRESLPT